MRTLISCVAALAMATSACGMHVEPDQRARPPSSSLWAADLIEPTTTPITIAPGTTVIILIQESPVDGIFLGGSEFFDDFGIANPAFIACNGIVNIFNNGLTPPPIGFPNEPTIGLILSPINFGSCTLPVNLGQNGNIFITIMVGNSAKDHKRESLPTVR